MPWQQMVADVGFEIDSETGLPAYREVIVTMPRQNGKTSLLLAAEVERALLWDVPQHIIYTAQTGADARKKLLDDQFPVLQKCKFIDKRISRYHRASGSEGIYFENHSRLQLAASSEKSGHGPTVDLAVLDEVWADEDNRREQSLVPMMNTRPAAQTLVVSTQGTDRSLFLNRKTERGRIAVEEGKGSGTAYFEYSIPLDEDISDPEVWWKYMPALGWTIPETSVQHSHDTMDEAEFRRAYCNQPTKTVQDRIIPQDVWEMVQGSVGADEWGRVTFGVDILPDRSAAAITAGDGQHVAVIEHRPGTGWIVDRMKELVGKWNNQGVVIDGGGPAVSIADELESQGVRVDRLSTPDLAAACARMYDDIAGARVTFEPSEAMDAALSGLQKRAMGDRFIWARQMSATDITPFVAATLAQSTKKEAEVAFHSFG